MLEVTSELSNVTDDPDFDIAQHIKEILDSADQERNIRTLANVSFSYDAEHWWYWNIFNVSGFIHASARDQIRDCSVESYIQPALHRLGPHVLGLRNTSRQITGPSILFPLICILFPSVYCFISCQFPSHCNSGKMRWPIFAAMILQCDKSMQFWSDPLKSSFAYCWNRVTVKIWSQYLQYLQSYLEIFISHLAAAVPLLETDNISPVCRYII